MARTSISVSRDCHARMSAYCAEHGGTLAELVELACADDLGLCMVPVPPGMVDSASSFAAGGRWFGAEHVIDAAINAALDRAGAP